MTTLYELCKQGYTGKDNSWKSKVTFNENTRFASNYVPELGLINIEAIKEFPSVATKQTGCFLETKFENEPSILAIQPLIRSKCRFLKGANCLFLPR